jgi:hypothetical protein
MLSGTRSRPGPTPPPRWGEEGGFLPLFPSGVKIHFVEIPSNFIGCYGSQTSPSRRSENFRHRTAGTKSTDVTYDRFIITGGAGTDYAGEAGVFRFDMVYGLNQTMTEDVSSHYSVYAVFWTGHDGDCIILLFSMVSRACRFFL